MSGCARMGVAWPTRMRSRASSQWGDQVNQERRNRAETPASGPVIAVLGTFLHEGLTAKIEGLGFTLVVRNLRSTPRNWASISAQIGTLVDQQRLPLVMMYLSSPMLLHIADPTYDDERRELIRQLERTKTLVFVYEDALQGVVTPFPWDIGEPPDDDEATDKPEDGFDDFRRLFAHPRDYARRRAEWHEKHKLEIDRGIALLRDLASRRIDLLPFRSRADVTLRMYEALDDAQAGVFLRLYIPHGRYQSEQFEDFVTLFSRFLREAEGRDFSVDVERTASGTAYVFKGRGEASTLEDLRSATSRFDAFLAMANSAPRQAEAQLVAAGIARTEAAFVVSKYARASNRLILESKHEFERRHLVLVQAMESELLEVNQTLLLPQLDSGRPSQLLSIVGNSAPVSVAIGRGTSVTVSTIESAEVIVGGTISYNPEDRLILERLDTLKDELRAAQLRSDLDRLKDPATSGEVR